MLEKSCGIETPVARATPSTTLEPTQAVARTEVCAGEGGREFSALSRAFRESDCYLGDSELGVRVWLR